MSAAPRDMTATAGWNAADRLGTHVAFGERVVLILRSRLVTHLAETAIFLAKAEPDGEFRKPGATQLMPVFRGPAGLDTAYFGFEITPEDLASDPGWYVVIQELSGAVRFGFDEEGPDADERLERSGLADGGGRGRVRRRRRRRSRRPPIPEASSGRRTRRTWPASACSARSGSRFTRPS